MKTIHLELNDTQAWALAELVKRIGWGELRQNAVDDAEAYEMRDAVELLAHALASAGVAPR